MLPIILSFKKNFFQLETRVLLCSPGLLVTCHIHQSGLEFTENPLSPLGLVLLFWVRLILSLTLQGLLGKAGGNESGRRVGERLSANSYSGWKVFPPRADISCKSWLADLRMSQKKLGNGDSELHIGFFLGLIRHILDFRL